MKRKYVLMVPVAAVTLLANSIGFVVNAASVMPYDGQSNIQWNAQNDNKDAKEANKAPQAPNMNKDQKGVNDKNVKAPGHNNDQKSIDKQKNKPAVSQDDKEKRRVALANDYEHRKNVEKPEVKKDAPKPPKKDIKDKKDKEPAPQKDSNLTLAINA